MRAMYNLWYRFGTPPWVGDARRDLVDLVTRGVLRPGRAVDLGCGVGDNAIFLAEHGFTVTGIDYSTSAIQRAKAKAAEKGVTVEFLVDDLMDLQHVRGPFDVVVDYGTFDDKNAEQRAQYVGQVLPLTRPGSQFLLWCFEWEVGPGWRIFSKVLSVGIAMAPGEIDRWFADHFEVQRIAGESGLRGWPHGWAAYLMTRK